MKKKCIAFILSALLVLSVAGCGSAGETGEAAYAVRQDGERFEAVIMLEGMEETVRYEHIVNDALGFEMDYDYELFVRLGEPGRERFVSVYDDPGSPENYFEVTFIPEDAGAAAASVGGELSKEYDIITEQFTLERAGSCIRIDASAARDGGGTPDLLQTVYIIPAASGSLIAAAHYSYESAEGFGRRFSFFMNTLTVMDRLRNYSANADGTWECEGHVYKYRLEITGRMPGAAADSTFVYLSNMEQIPFDRAWKAAGLSSSTDDYFDADDAVLVELRTEKVSSGR
ncbi:MAG: hypothetical protein CW338_08950 [Clostridiales bacterium]|nr:hypothetical protein [Clostridiales bacterium]